LNTEKKKKVVLDSEYNLRLINYLGRLESQRGWRPAYGISASAEHTTVLSSCFALFIYELIGELQQFSTTERSDWASFLQSFQAEKSGLFLDPLARRDEFTNRKHDWQYFTWQTTFFCLSALDALGAKPLHPLKFIQPYLGPAAITAWLDGLNWHDPWLESNKVMFLTSFLIQSSEMEAAHSIFDWLDAHQDPHTGYWGTQHGASLLNAMAGAFHFYFLYLYLQRPFQHLEQIIDSTLSLQQPDGLYDPRGGGGACLDLDAVDILVKVSLLTDYHSADIKGSLRRTHQAILANQRLDGSFCEAMRLKVRKSSKRKIAEFFGIDRLLNRVQVPGREPTSFSGWEKMKYYLDEGDLWSSWFRLLTLDLISTFSGDQDPVVPPKIKFRSSPALGWHDPHSIIAMKELFTG